MRGPQALQIRSPATASSVGAGRAWPYAGVVSLAEAGIATKGAWKAEGKVSRAATEAGCALAGCEQALPYRACTCQAKHAARRNACPDGSPPSGGVGSPSRCGPSPSREPERGGSQCGGAFPAQRCVQYQVLLVVICAAQSAGAVQVRRCRGRGPCAQLVQRSWTVDCALLEHARQPLVVGR